MINGQKQSGWIGVDLDGTLAEYDGWKGPSHIGKPIPAMLNRVKEWIAKGIEVRCFTARAVSSEFIFVRAWLDLHGLESVGITNVKDKAMIELWDDRAVGVIPNTGITHESGVALHLSRLCKAVGVTPVDGQTYKQTVDLAIEKINPGVDLKTDLAAYIDGAADRLTYIKDNGDARAAALLLHKALKALKS